MSPDRSSTVYLCQLCQRGKRCACSLGKTGTGSICWNRRRGSGGGSLPFFCQVAKSEFGGKGGQSCSRRQSSLYFRWAVGTGQCSHRNLAHSRRAAIPPLSCPRSSAPQPSSFPSTPPLNAASNTKKRHSHATPSALLAKDPASNLGHSCCWQDREARADERDACEACLCDSPPSPTVVDDIPELLTVRPPLLSARSPPTSNGPQGPRACDCDSLRQSARLSTSRPPAH